ncbi:MAG: hypothetical protein IPK50_07115 [Fibrobacterota bacterium]|nr:MAG: hypothetical protein IPK50_07115 [Fibrobacterota bacterium]
MKSKFFVALPLLAVLIGCSETSTDPGSAANDPKPIPASLSAWATAADLSLPGDAVVQIPGLESRWDSVANLVRHSDEVRKDLQTIFADWNSRTPQARDWDALDSSTSSSGGKLYLTAFSVDGIRQGGLVWIPATTGPTPVILFGHPSDNGISNTIFALLERLMGTTKNQCIVVMPAFRGETADLGGKIIPSNALTASPWDRDVDDGLAMLQAVLDKFPQADASRISAVGYSRGAGVALLSALRDRRIKSVFEISGPTDFFAASIQNLSKDLSAGKSIALPGLDVIESKYLVPFRNGTISADSLRTVLLARSAARLAISGLLPTTVAVHGTADTVVYPDQAAALKSADSRVDHQSFPGMTHTSMLFGADQPKVAQSLQSFLKAVFGL